MSEPQFVAERITAGYYAGVDIIEGVSLRAERGEVVALIGPNGAGKSTLVKTFVGQLPPRSGDVRLEGESLAAHKPSEIAQRGLCYVPQSRNVFPNLTVGENLEIGGYLAGQRVRREIARVLDFFPDLRGKVRAKAGTLSGGQRQMLAMGRALMLKPQLLVLDEPSAGLAPQLVELVFEKIRQINELGCTVMMVEQNARRALGMADRGYVLDMGRNAIEDRGEKLLRDPTVIELYLGQLARGGTGA